MFECSGSNDFGCERIKYQVLNSMSAFINIDDCWAHNDDVYIETMKKKSNKVYLSHSQSQEFKVDKFAFENNLTCQYYISNAYNILLICFWLKITNRFITQRVTHIDKIFAIVFPPQFLI